MITTIIFSVWLYFTLFFLAACFKRDISFIDVGWGPGFAWLFLTCAIAKWPNLGMLQWLVGALVFAWSIRLAWYLHGRNRKKGEDPRYKELAKKWRGPYWLNAYLRVFMIQGLLLAVVAAPIIIVMIAPAASLTTISIIGVIIALTGLTIEAAADWQMAQFQEMRPRPAKFCRLGLWKHSRHPNYFGEMVFWFGVAITVVNVPNYYYAFIGPVVLTFLLLKVSGIPMLEDKYKDHPEWPTYESQTRMLLPLPKKG